jgi:hypothetical protein
MVRTSNGRHYEPAICSRRDADGWAEAPPTRRWTPDRCDASRCPPRDNGPVARPSCSTRTLLRSGRRTIPSTQARSSTSLRSGTSLAIIPATLHAAVRSGVAALVRLPATSSSRYGGQSDGTHTRDHKAAGRISRTRRPDRAQGRRQAVLYPAGRHSTGPTATSAAVRRKASSTGAMCG